MRLLGLHLRMVHSLQEVIDQALRFSLPMLQCFLTDHASGKVLSVTDEERDLMKSLSSQMGMLCVHASYRTNLCRPDHRNFHTLRKEIKLAALLGFHAVIIHPGSAKWCRNKQRGLEELVSSLDSLTQKDIPVKITLENVAHGGYSIGGLIDDFAYVKRRVRRPDQICFCIDTAHAYAYGYDLSDFQAQDDFITLLESAIGLDSVTVLHLNDSKKGLGKRIDQHADIGQGNICDEALKRFILHEKLAHIPVILELPALSQDACYASYKKVLQWHESLPTVDMAHEVKKELL
ncbi:deoxyribonuclease IV [Candidatus Babeliales bacterium]|nr:deoxyribonuclease IV [Candidatus Babeliales bacterium]